MAKKSKSSKAVSFEEALAKLEEIVRELEDGQLGLSESLARYEEGVRHLERCQQLIPISELASDVDLSVRQLERRTAPRASLRCTGHCSYAHVIRETTIQAPRATIRSTSIRPRPATQ